MKILILIFTLLLQSPDGYVTDEVGLLSLETHRQVEQTIAKFEKETQIEIGVLIRELPSNREAFEYALETAESWGVGKDGADNGVFIYLAPEARKWQILTGYGIEGYLTDYATSRIGRNNIVPNMRDGDPNLAVTATVNAIIEELGVISMAERERMAQLAAQERKEAMSTFFTWLIWILGIAGTCIGIFAYYQYKQRKKEELEAKKKKYRRQTKRLGYLIQYLDKLHSEFNCPSAGDAVKQLKHLKRKREDQVKLSANPIPFQFTRMIEKVGDLQRCLSVYDYIKQTGMPSYRAPQHTSDDPNGILDDLEYSLKNLKAKSLSVVDQLEKELDFTEINNLIMRLNHYFQEYKRRMEELEDKDRFFGNIKAHASDELASAKAQYDDLGKNLEKAEKYIEKSERDFKKGDYYFSFNYAQTALDAIRREQRRIKRKKEEEERRRRRNRRSSYSSSSFSSSSSFGGSSSSGSSFGGGSFGGGGSGGSW